MQRKKLDQGVRRADAGQKRRDARAWLSTTYPPPSKPTMVLSTIIRSSTPHSAAQVSPRMLACSGARQTRAAAIAPRRFPSPLHSHSFSSTTMAPRDPSYRVITNDTINKAVLNAEYAVRGAIAIRAEELRDDLEAGKKLPFDQVVSCNIGNPQQLDQKPLTYLRQVSVTSVAR